jgi:hypothetical protein
LLELDDAVELELVFFEELEPLDFEELDAFEEEDPFTIGMENSTFQILGSPLSETTTTYTTPLSGIRILSPSSNSFLEYAIFFARESMDTESVGNSSKPSSTR